MHKKERNVKEQTTQTTVSQFHQDLFFENLADDKNEKQNYCGKDKWPCVLGGEQQKHEEKHHIPCVNTFSHFKKQT